MTTSFCFVFQDGNTCVFDCPPNSFSNINGTCQLCSANCIKRNDNSRLCSGSKPVPGNGGCNYCMFIEASKKLEIKHCLAHKPPTFFYPKTIPSEMRQSLRSFIDYRSYLFIRCHPACLKCTDSSPDTCDRCADGYLRYKGRQCFKKCPPGEQP